MMYGAEGDEDVVLEAFHDLKALLLGVHCNLRQVAQLNTVLHLHIGS